MTIKNHTDRLRERERERGIIKLSGGARDGGGGRTNREEEEEVKFYASSFTAATGCFSFREKLTTNFFNWTKKGERKP